MVENFIERQNNVKMATGRVGGRFLEHGNPRGGGARRVEERRATFYQAVQLSCNKVFENLGIGDGGRRTPYEQLAPAIKPVEVRVITVYQGNIPVGKTIIEMPQDAQKGK